MFQAIVAMQEHFIESTAALQGRRDECTDDEQYEVDYILDSRIHDGKLQYRVKWAGYKDDRVVRRGEF